MVAIPAGHKPVVIPVIKVGATIEFFINNVFAALAPQPLFAVTDNVPVVQVEPNTTVPVVPVPDTVAAPVMLQL